MMYEIKVGVSGLTSTEFRLAVPVNRSLFHRIANVDDKTPIPRIGMGEYIIHSMFLFMAAIDAKDNAISDMHASTIAAKRPLPIPTNEAVERLVALASATATGSNSTTPFHSEVPNANFETVVMSTKKSMDEDRSIKIIVKKIEVFITRSALNRSEFAQALITARLVNPQLTGSITVKICPSWACAANSVVPKATRTIFPAKNIESARIADTAIDRIKFITAKVAAQFGYQNSVLNGTGTFEVACLPI